MKWFGLSGRREDYLIKKSIAPRGYEKYNLID
jgi:hypothetical protein